MNRTRWLEPSVVVAESSVVYSLVYSSRAGKATGTNVAQRAPAAAAVVLLRSSSILRREKRQRVVAPTRPRVFRGRFASGSEEGWHQGGRLGPKKGSGQGHGMTLPFYAEIAEFARHALGLTYDVADPQWRILGGAMTSPSRRGESMPGGPAGAATTLRRRGSHPTVRLLPPVRVNAGAIGT